jgi:valyl-tRNA synthetase
MGWTQRLRGGARISPHVCHSSAQVTQSQDGNERQQEAVELVVRESIQVILPLRGLFNAEKEVQRLEKQRGKVDKELSGLQARLSNAQFVNNAPGPVVEQATKQAQDLTDQLRVIDDKLAQARALLQNGA